jgi:metal-responsive CopG/Arc/MetJ family transcriptional regulator
MRYINHMIKSPKRRQRGRPFKGADAMEQIAIRFPRPMLLMVDQIIAGRLDRPDRSSVIRELVAEALQVRELSKRH